jgi:DUF1009 family protein
MPALPESGVTGALPQRVALVAGSGHLPARFLMACESKGIDVFVVALDGQTDPHILTGRQHMMTRIGAAGKIIQTLKAHDFMDIVFIGAVRRPSLSEMRPDLRTAGFFLRLGLKAVGDDGLLQAVRKELERDGFRLHGVQKFMQDSLSVAGSVGRVKPGKAEWAGIAHGATVAREIGRLDIGQSVIVQEGLVLGVEGVEGTDELIRRCARYKRKGHGPILVKATKPQQDRDLDLPTIGPDTVQLCADCGMAGIAVEAGNSLIIDPETVAELADKYKMFVVAADFNKVIDDAA